MSEEKDRKASPTPKPVGRVPGVAADASELERTRELPPGALSGVSWPRPSPRSGRPGVLGASPPASESPSKAPAAGPGMTPSPPRPASSRPPEPQKERAPSQRPAPEELSGSLLVPDDGLSEPGPLNVEELSGSVLVEDAPGGGPPIVTRTAATSPSQRPVAAENPALLGMPELPKATPGPTLEPTQPPSAWQPAPLEQPMPEVEIVDTQWVPDPEADEVTLFDERPDGGAAPPEDGLAGSSEALTIVRSSPPGTPPPPAAVHRDDVEVTALPRTRVEALEHAARSAVATLQSRIRSAGVLPRGPRAPWFWAAIAIPTVAIGAALVALVLSPDDAERRHGAAGTARSSAATTSSPARPLPSPATSSSARTEAPAPVLDPRLKPCVIAGSSHAVAPRAIVGAGVEVRPFGEDVAIGFAPDDHEAVGMRLDARSLAASAASKVQSKDPIRRVLPVAIAGGLGLTVDADRKGDHLTGRRSLPVDPPLQIGVFGANLVWSYAGGPVAGTLWPLEGEGDVEALRGATEGAPGDTITAIAFRRGNTVWLGTATGYKALAPKGSLGRVRGLGPTIGSPAVALNDGVAIAAWADRTSPDNPWSLRWVRFKAGEAPGTPRAFVPPPGGQGGQAMSPGLAAVPGGRFLLVWTEGPMSFHHVRALTLSSDGDPVGRPLAISADGANAGQGQAAVSPAGTGIVAFLESTEDGFRVAAAPIACGSQ